MSDVTTGQFQLTEKQLAIQEAALIMQAIVYGCPSTIAFLSIHNIATWMLDSLGYATIPNRYLPCLTNMERTASYALTEPGSGWDAASLTMRGELQGASNVMRRDCYLVSGTKQSISGAGANDVYLTMVRTGGEEPGGISCLAIGEDMPGGSFAPDKKVGWHSQPTATLILDQVRVPADNLVGKEGDGFRIAMAGLDGGRPNVGACFLGGAQRCLTRRSAIRGSAGNSAAPSRISTTRSSASPTWRPSWKRPEPSFIPRQPKSLIMRPKTRSAAMAKRLPTDAGSAVADRALQLFGGYGYLQDYPIRRFWRDLRVHSILQGTNQIMRLIIGRDLLRD